MSNENKNTNETRNADEPSPINYGNNTNKVTIDRGTKAPPIDLKKDINKLKSQVDSPIVLPTERKSTSSKLADMISQGTRYIHAVYIESLDDTVYLRELSEEEIVTVNKLSLPGSKGKKMKVSRDGGMEIDSEDQLNKNEYAERYLVLSCLDNEIQVEILTTNGITLDSETLGDSLSGRVFKEIVMHCKLINSLNIADSDLKALQTDIERFRKNSKLTDVVSSS